MSTAQVIVDYQSVGVNSTTTYTLPSLDKAQAKVHELCSGWEADGWTKRHDCWFKLINFRQVVIEYKGVTYTQEDGTDE